MSSAFGAGKVAAAAIAKWGSTATLYRKSTATEAADGSDLSKWVPTPEGDGVKILIEPLSVIAAQKLFGTETDIRFRGFVKDSAPVDLEKATAIVITRGHYKGLKFRVVEAPPWPIAGVLQLGLSATKDVIG